MDWNIGILKEVKESNLSSITYCFVYRFIHFNSGITVIKNAFLNSQKSFLSQVTLNQSIFSIVDNQSVFTVELFDFHFIFGQSASFAAANFLDTSHFLRCIKFSNQNSFLVHFHYTECKWDTDGKWESFWNGHNNQNDDDIGKGSCLLQSDSSLWWK